MTKKECKKCSLHLTRRTMVEGRGEIPADLLIVGEAPGKSEDLLGKPFIGPSGRLLDRALSEAATMAKVDMPSIYITNIVACRPCDAKNGPNRPPSPEEIAACAPRLAALARRVRPRAVLLLGKVAQRECKSIFPRALGLVHPAYLLRSGGTASAGYLPFVRSISELLAEVGGQSSLPGLDEYPTRTTASERRERSS